MDPVDNLAQSLLVGLVICSVMSDGYIMVKNMFHDKKTVENLEYCQDVLKAVSSYGLDKYDKMEDGSIQVKEIIRPKEEEVQLPKEEEIIHKEEEVISKETDHEEKKSKIVMKISEKIEQEKEITPWEQRGMTREEYEQYRLKRRRERENGERVSKREKNKTISHK